jgi:hypothetical protein
MSTPIEPVHPIVHIGQGEYGRYLMPNGKWYTGNPDKQTKEDKDDREKTNNKKEHGN